jgi:RecA-family ATPase
MAEKSEAASTKLSLVPFNQFMADNAGDEMDWMVENWVPDRTILFVVAAPESYKTWLTFDLAISVASGEDFLGKFKVNKTGPVVLFQQEDFAGSTQQRLSVIAYSRLNMGDIQGNKAGDISVPARPSLPIYIHTERKLRFDDEEAMASLRSICEQIRPKLVIIDPLYAAGPTENFMTEMATLMGPLKGLRDEFGTTFVVVHHRKKGGNAEDREGAWGSQFINAFIESGWQVAATRRLRATHEA